MDELLPFPDNGICTNCGEGSLMLAEDATHYSTLWVSPQGAVIALPGETEPSGAWDAVRCFCTSCGTYFVPPEIERP